MSNPITESLAGGIAHAFSLADAFIEVCPEDIWKKKFGGWPVWQQLYHSFSSIDFFLRPAGAPESPALFDHSVGDFKTSPEAPSKADFKGFTDKMQARVREYIAGLSDAALADKNEGMSSRFGRPCTQAFTLQLIASHMMYHIGGCDAALREHGHKGVF